MQSVQSSNKTMYIAGGVLGVLVLGAGLYLTLRPKAPSPAPVSGKTTKSGPSAQPSPPGPAVAMVNLADLQEFPPTRLTSNSDSGYVVTASNTDAGKAEPFDYNPYYAFGGTKSFQNWSTHWNTASAKFNNDTGVYEGTSVTTVDGNPVRGEWLQLQLPTPILLVSFVLSPAQTHVSWSGHLDFSMYRSPRLFMVAGSNDGATWTRVFGNLGTKGANDWRLAPKLFFVDDALTRTRTKYAYYRLIVARVGNFDAASPVGQQTVAIHKWVLHGLP